MKEARNELLKVIQEDKIFRPINNYEHKGINLNQDWWIFLEYENLFILGFYRGEKIPQGDVVIIDVELSNSRRQEDYIPQTYIDIETLISKAPKELRDFVIFNLNLFQCIKICEATKYE